MRVYSTVCATPITAQKIFSFLYLSRNIFSPIPSSLQVLDFLFRSTSLLSISPLWLSLPLSFNRKHIWPLTQLPVIHIYSRVSLPHEASGQGFFTMLNTLLHALKRSLCSVVNRRQGGCVSECTCSCFFVQTFRQPRHVVLWFCLLAVGAVMLALTVFTAGSRSLFAPAHTAL